MHTVAFYADAQRGPFGISLPSAEIDEATLQKISATAGASSARATPQNWLASMPNWIGSELVDEDAEPIRPRQELFHYPPPRFCC